MFIEKDDLKNTLYGYQIEQITEGDNSIVIQAMVTAEEEVKSYLYGNHKREYLDGRFRYDVDKIFTAQGEQRNPLIVSHCTTIAKWHIIQRANVDVLHEQAKERYDRSIEWLQKLNKGEVTLSTLPIIAYEDTPDADNAAPFVYGSRLKFNHD